MIGDCIIMEISTVAIVVGLVYYFLVYLTTKLYIKRVDKELDTKFKSVIAFLAITAIYILFTFVSIKIYNYASIETNVDMEVSWLTVDWPSTDFNSVSVLVAITFQVLLNIIYVYLVTLFVKGNINSKLKRNIGMLIFYICGLASIIILTFGFYGFLQGRSYDFEILKLLSDTTIFSIIALYPVFIYKDLLLKKKCNCK